MPTPQQNKQAVVDMFEVLSRGDFDTARAKFLAPDCRFWHNGDTSGRGWYDIEQFIRQATYVVPDGLFTFDFGRLIAEGDTVVVEAESHCRLKNGKDYNNTYVFLLEFRDGKIVEFLEHTDTLHELQTIDMPGVRGESFPRESPLTTVTHSLVNGRELIDEPVPEPS
jgi:ketosteroid isomerase-like protein